MKAARRRAPCKTVKANTAPSRISSTPATLPLSAVVMDPKPASALPAQPDARNQHPDGNPYLRNHSQIERQPGHRHAEKRANRAWRHGGQPGAEAEVKSGAVRDRDTLAALLSRLSVGGSSLSFVALLLL